MNTRTGTVVACWFAGRVGLHLLKGMGKAIMLPTRHRLVRHAWIRKWSGKLLRLMGLRVVVEGCIPGAIAKPIMLIANHVSWLDICLINSMTPVRFIAKADVRNWPCIGLLATAAGSFFLRRGRVRDVWRVNREVCLALQSGDAVCFFAEGTTTEGSRLLHFNSGLLQGALDAKARVYPVAIRYSFKGSVKESPAAFVGEMSFVQSMLRILMHRGITAEMYYAPVISTEGKHRHQIALEAQEVIAEWMKGRAETCGRERDRCPVPDEHYDAEEPGALSHAFFHEDIPLIIRDEGSAPVICRIEG